MNHLPAVYMDSECVIYVPQSGSYPQKAVLIHSYEAVFHNCPHPNIGFLENDYPISSLCSRVDRRGYPQKKPVIHSYSMLFHKLRRENEEHLRRLPPYLPRKKRERVRKKRKRDIPAVPFPLVAAVMTATRVLSQLSHNQARCAAPLRLYNLSRIANTSRRMLSSLSMDWVILSTP